MLSNRISSIIDNCALFNQPCLLCRGSGGRRGLCDACLADLPRLPPAHCPQCGDYAPGGQLCGHCQCQAPGFDLLHAALLYDWPLSALIHAFKYGKALPLAHTLGQLLAELAPPARMPPDLVVPVPLAPARLAERGFNQSLELARPFAARIGAPLDAALCVRVRNTAAQVRLNRRQRQHNLRHAFDVNQDLAGACVAIVDDVATSGSTLSELALTLKKHGAARVEAWVLARVFYSKT